MFRTPSRRRLRKALNTWALTLALATITKSLGPVRVETPVTTIGSVMVA